MGLTEILGRSLHFIRTSPQILLLYILYSVAFLLSIRAVISVLILVPDQTYIIIDFILILILIVIFVFVGVLVYSILIFCVRDYMCSNDISLSTAWNNTKKHIKGLVLLTLLLIVFGIVLGLISVFIFFALCHLNWFVGLVTMIALMFLIVFILIFVYPAFLVDEFGYIKSFEQSWRVAKRNALDVILLIIIFGFLNYVLEKIAGISPSLIILVGIMVLSIFLSTYQYTCVTILYINRAHLEEEW